MFFNCPPNVWLIIANQRWEWESYSLPCYYTGSPACILGLTVLVPKEPRYDYSLGVSIDWALGIGPLEAKAKEGPAKYAEIWGLSKDSLRVVWAGKPSLHRYWQIPKYHFHQTCGRWSPWWQWLELKTGNTVHRSNGALWQPHLRAGIWVCRNSYEEHVKDGAAVLGARRHMAEGGSIAVW